MAQFFIPMLLEAIIATIVSMAVDNAAYACMLQQEQKLVKEEAYVAATKRYTDKLEHMLAAETAISNMGEAAIQQLRPAPITPATAQATKPAAARYREERPKVTTCACVLAFCKFH